jgi:hypothetical protein
MEPGPEELTVSFLSELRSSPKHDPLRRSRARANPLRTTRIRRAAAGAVVAITAGGALLGLPGHAVPVQPNDGAAIARVTHWVRHAAHLAYIDLVRERAHGATLVRSKFIYGGEDFDATRDDVRAQINHDVATLRHAETILTSLGHIRDQWFHLYAGTADSPILGPAKLNAQQMADFVKASGVRVHTTVPILELAQIYLEEGEVEGVRGDVAFAQAILETGSFGFAGSRVAGTDNNFAGLGACSACPHGDRFATARAGVRAQLQFLRWLADPTVHHLTDFASQPATVPSHFLHNAHTHPTWTSLGGLWSPNPAYGKNVYALYLRMHTFADNQYRRTHA